MSSWADAARACRIPVGRSPSEPTSARTVSVSSLFAAGSRSYLVITSPVGLVAGIITVVQVNRETLAILVSATIGLWAAATARHAIDRTRGAVAVG
jgi:hypothetical protein